MRLILALCVAFALPDGANADPLAKTREVLLHPADGPFLSVARVTLSADGQSSGYSIEWNDDQFTDHFLSMRPFKCLEGNEKLWCRVPYPYTNARTVSEDDLTDLEYDLMFVWKNEGEYGINLWNGVYYRLAIDGERLVGIMNDIDMNVLASPPDDGNLRPIADSDLEEADADSQWLPRMTIE